MPFCFIAFFVVHSPDLSSLCNDKIPQIKRMFVNMYLFPQKRPLKSEGGQERRSQPQCAWGWGAAQCVMTSRCTDASERERETSVTLHMARLEHLIEEAVTCKPAHRRQMGPTNWRLFTQFYVANRRSFDPTAFCAVHPNNRPTNKSLQVIMQNTNHFNLF